MVSTLNQGFLDRTYNKDALIRFSQNRKFVGNFLGHICMQQSNFVKADGWWWSRHSNTFLNLIWNLSHLRNSCKITKTSTRKKKLKHKTFLSWKISPLENWFRQAWQNGSKILDFNLLLNHFLFPWFSWWLYGWGQRKYFWP